MLLDASQMGRLQAYIDMGSDGELLTWWAQLAESNDQLDTALQYYERAEDHLAQVRVLSFRNELKGAAQVAEASENASAAYHLARHLEARGETEEAIKFYQRAGRFIVVDEPTPPPQSDSEQIAELIEVDDLAECEDDYR